MAKYWQKRPVFEAVQLRPENAKKIKEMAGCAEVGFSDNCCFFTLYSRPQQESQNSWLVVEPNYNIKIWSDSEFKEIFEQVENDVIDEVVNDITDAEVIAELIEAIRFTVEYVGTDMLPPIEGWSWYDVLSKYSPETAATFKAKSNGSSS